MSNSRIIKNTILATFTLVTIYDTLNSPHYKLRPTAPSFHDQLWPVPVDCCCPGPMTEQQQSTGPVLPVSILENN